MDCRVTQTQAHLNPIQEPTTPNRLSDKEDMPGPPSACTPACTSEGKPDRADPVVALAAALLGLSPEDKARLAALLLGQEAGR
jgi:hypothetical protein